MNCNEDYLDFINEFHQFVDGVSIEQFAECMGKDFNYAKTDSWIVEKYQLLKNRPLELLVNFDRGHQALLLRAIVNPRRTLDASFKNRNWAYEYFNEEIGAFVCIDYTVDCDNNYGADADGNRGTPVHYVEIVDYCIHLNGIYITDWFDEDEVNIEDNDALREILLEHYRSI